MVILIQMDRQFAKNLAWLVIACHSLSWFDFGGHLGQSIRADGKDRKRVSREPREPREYYFEKVARGINGKGK